MDLPRSLALLSGHAIEITVERGTTLRRARVLGLMRDWERYPEWWPLPCVRSVKGLIVAPAPFVRLLLVPEPTGDDTVRFRYEGGPFRGVGVWHVTGSDPAVVAYTVNLRPAHTPARWVSGTRAFRAKHRRDIEGIIDSMEAAPAEAPG